MKRFLLIGVCVLIAVQAGFGCTVIGYAEVARTFQIELKYSEKPLAMPIYISATSTGKVVRQTKTDANGHATITNLEPGSYSIESPVSNDVVEVVPQGGGDVLHVEARFEAPIEVANVNATITDPIGAVIPRTTVALESADTRHSPVAAGTTDDAGSISLKASEGDYLLRIASKGFRTALIPLRITKRGWPGFTVALSIGGCGAPPVPLSITPKE